MFPIIFCTIFTFVQMVQYISLLEVFTETRPWFQKHKVLVIILATANCILWAFVFDKYLYVKTVVAILSFFVITKVVVNVKNTVASALSMMYYNFMIIFEYCVIVLVAKIDLFRNVTLSMDFEKVVTYFETLYLSDRIKIALKGILIIGY